MTNMRNAILFEQTRNSDYRKRIKVLAFPIDDKLKRRVEFARLLHQTAKERKEADRGLVFDLPAFLQAYVSLEQAIDEHAKYDPLFADIVSASLLPDFDYKKFLALYREHGSFIFPTSKCAYSGCLLSECELLGVLTSIAALSENIGAENSGYIPDESLAFIDTVNILEEVVFTINVFRFFELEPMSSLLLTKNEFEKLDEGEVKSLVQRRLHVISRSSERFNKEELFALIDEINEAKTRQGELLSAMKISATGFGALVTASHFDQDEVQHTLNFLNSLVHSGIIVNSVIDHLEKNLHLDKSGSVALANLVHIAFGDPYYKLGAIYHQALSGQTNIPGSEIVCMQYLPQLARLLGYQQGQGTKRAAYLLLSRNEEQIKEAARKLLDEELRRLTGRRIDDVFNVREFERITSTTFITRDHLPLIVGIWKERYGEDKTVN